MSDHDDDTVRLLRETLTERAGTVDDTPPAVPARPAPAPRPTWTPILAAVAAAVVGILAVGGVTAWRDSHRAPVPTSVDPMRAATPTPTPTPAPAVAVPAGWKPVASLGIQVYVPPDWQVTGALNEGCAMRDGTAKLVSRPMGGSNAMGCFGPPKGSLVVFRQELMEGEAPGRHAIAGGQTRIAWVGPARSAVVASGPDAALLQRIVDTARAVDVDALGCRTEGVRPEWDKPRPGLAKISANPSDVVGCVYAPDPWRRGAWLLVASNRFTAAEREALSVALQRAPAGTAPDVPDNCAPDLPEDGYALLQLRTAAGVTPLTMHWSGCLDRYAATADAQTAMTERLLTTVMDAVKVGYAFNVLPKG